MDIRQRNDKAEWARIQDEIITAKWIQKENPAICWTECLKLAKKHHDQK